MRVKDHETKTAKWNSAFNNFFLVLLIVSVRFLLSLRMTIPGKSTNQGMDIHPKQT